MDDIPLKFTIATVTYNAAGCLQRTVDSVANQDYPYVEHLFVDGNSQDGTLEIYHHYQERNSTAAIRHELVAVSEPDEGLYDAMNKALNMATGDYILFLNAGDSLHSTDTLSRVAAAAADRPAVLYGDTDIIDSEGNFVRRRRLQPPARLTWRSFRHGMLVCHQSFFARTDLARSTHFDRRYRFSADFDWCVRIMRKAHWQGLALRNTGVTVSDYLEEGLSTLNHRESLRERFCIMAYHYGWISTVAMHLWFVVRSFIKK